MIRRIVDFALNNRLLVLALATPLALADDPAPYGPIADVKLIKPEDKVDVASVPAPSGALVLFDGTSLDGWTKRNGKDAAAFKILRDAVAAFPE